MRYIKAEDVLPREVITLIQQYVDGVTLYIPRKAENRRPWGCDTPYRAELEQRNHSIRQEFRQGKKVEELAQKYHLCPKSIRRILRKT